VAPEKQETKWAQPPPKMADGPTPESQKGCCRKLTDCIADQCTYLKLTKLMKFLSVVTTLAIGGVEGYGLYKIVTSALDSVQAGLTVVSLIFLVGTAFIALLSTFETDFIKTHLALISGWKGLGIFQIFLAALTLSTLGPVLNYSHADTLTTFAQVSAFCLAAVGALHFFFGLFGGENIKKKKEAEMARMASNA